ncbi:MAG: hypothetical protein O2888_05275 [Chloroflexi bacterium]|nr:hypothetical protein [Chloroflexota bacterium]
MARELVWANTLLGRAYEGGSLAAAVADLLDGSGWTAGSLNTPSHTITARFDGLSTWSALGKVAQVFGVHLREDPRTRTVDLGTFGESTGIVLQNVATADPALAENPRVYAVGGVRIASESHDVWNRVIPVGAGEGVNQLDLRHCDRSVVGGDPYDVQSDVGPDGLAYYYIEDAASVASYGRRVKPLVVKEAVPLANSLAGFRAAANALYDVSATWLQRRKEPVTSYDVTVAGLRHVDAESGTPLIELGEQVRLRYRGIVQDVGGAHRAWEDVDAHLWLMGFQRTFTADGVDSWQLTLNSVDRVVEDPAITVARTFEDFHGLQVALKPYTYREVHGPQRDSVQSGSRIEFSVRFDENVTLLHQARLSVAIRRVRSNAASAAAGGGQTPTSSGSGSLTSDLGGFGSGGSSWDGGHTHILAGFTGWVGYGSIGADHGHTQNGWADTAGGHSHSFSYNPHSHTVASHSHLVPIANHTHSLVYGLFEGPAPSTPGVELHINGGNYTVPLGGPWNADFELDITQHLQDADGQPLRQENVLWFYANELVDLEIAVRSLVTATSLIPVA